MVQSRRADLSSPLSDSWGSALTHKSHRRINARRAFVPSRLIPRGELAAFLALWLMLTIIGWVVMYELQITNLDATSRSLSAFYVLFSRRPHLGAIGFVWTPLLSILQLPLLLILKPIGMVTFAGPITSSGFGAGLLLVLNRILHEVGRVTLRWRILWLALIMLNPLVLYLSVTGMTEIPFTFFTVLAIYKFLSWSRDPEDNWRSLLTMSFALAAAFYLRYETIALIAAMIVAIFAQGVTRRNWTRPKLIKLVADMLMAIIPAAYAIALWLLLNWIIQGDPLYFQHSDYSLASAPDVARNNGPTNAYYRAIASPVETARVVIQRIGLAVPLYVPLLALTALIAIHQRSAQAFGLAALCASIIAFQALMVYQGTLPPWQRYWVYAVPLSIPLIGYLCSLFPSTRRTLWWPLGVRLLITIGLLGSIPLQMSQMVRHTAGSDEQLLIASWTSPSAVPSLRQQNATPQSVLPVARYINAYIFPSTVLVDTEEAGILVVSQIQHPEKLVMTNDSDFFQILRSPQGKVDYILARGPEGDGKWGNRYQVEKWLPGFWDNGAGIGTLIREFSGRERFRLYALVPIPDVAKPSPNAKATPTIGSVARATLSPVSQLALKQSTLPVTGQLRAGSMSALSLETSPGSGSRMVARHEEQPRRPGWDELRAYLPQFSTVSNLQADRTGSIG